MSRTIADELKECAATAQLVRDNFWCLRMMARLGERTLLEVSDSLASLINPAQFASFDRWQCQHNRIRARISETVETADHLDVAPRVFRRPLVDLKERMEGVIRRVESA